MKKYPRSSGLKQVICSKCNSTEMWIDKNSVSGICWKCVCHMTRGTICDNKNDIDPIFTANEFAVNRHTFEIESIEINEENNN